MNIAAAGGGDCLNLFIVQDARRWWHAQVTAVAACGCWGETEKPLTEARLQRPLPVQDFLIALPQCLKQIPEIRDEPGLADGLAKVMLNTYGNLAALHRNDLAGIPLAPDFHLGGRVIHDNKRAFRRKDVDVERSFAPDERPIVNRDDRTTLSLLDGFDLF